MQRRSNDPVGTYLRAAKTVRRTGAKRCVTCGTPHAIVAKANPPVCARCHAIQTGRSPYEEHHPAGDINHPATVLVPIEAHRSQLTPAMYAWPKETRENPEASPLLAAAASLRGLYDTLDYLLYTLLLRVAVLLEMLDRTLRHRIGPRYWIELELLEGDDLDI
jgi:hypothetical protein